MVAGLRPSGLEDVWLSLDGGEWVQPGEYLDVSYEHPEEDAYCLEVGELLCAPTTDAATLVVDLGDGQGPRTVRTLAWCKRRAGAPMPPRPTPPPEHPTYAPPQTDLPIPGSSAEVRRSIAESLRQANAYRPLGPGEEPGGDKFKPKEWAEDEEPGEFYGLPSPA